MEVVGFVQRRRHEADFKAAEDARTAREQRDAMRVQRFEEHNLQARHEAEESMRRREERARALGEAVQRGAEERRQALLARIAAKDRRRQLRLEEQAAAEERLFHARFAVVPVLPL